MNETKRSTLFRPDATEPFRLSRSKLQLFLDCARCFVLDRRHGVARPDGMMPSINITVDALMKREFDDYRAAATKHPIMALYGVDAVPCRHPYLHVWRDNFKGVEFAHKSGFLVHGALDDLWETPQSSFVVAEYKAMSSEMTPSTEWMPDMHRRQMEIYQWLLRKNGLTVEPTGYFVFANADKAQPSLGNALKFTLNVLPYAGSDTWIEDALEEAMRMLRDDALPAPSLACDWCDYRKASRGRER